MALWTRTPHPQHRRRPAGIARRDGPADWDADPDWDFNSAAADTPDQLLHLATPGGRHVNLRRLACDLIEEYGRHTGHADLLREAVDGRIGEDPPAEWHPKSGAITV